MNEYTPSTDVERVVGLMVEAVKGEHDADSVRVPIRDLRAVIAALTAPPATGDEREALAQVIADSVWSMESGEYIDGKGELNGGNMQLAHDISRKFTVTPKNGDN